MEVSVHEMHLCCLLLLRLLLPDPHRSPTILCILIRLRLRRALLLAIAILLRSAWHGRPAATPDGCARRAAVAAHAGVRAHLRHRGAAALPAADAQALLHVLGEARDQQAALARGTRLPGNVVGGFRGECAAGAWAGGFGGFAAVVGVLRGVLRGVVVGFLAVAWSAVFFTARLLLGESGFEEVFVFLFGGRFGVGVTGEGLAMNIVTRFLDEGVSGAVLFCRVGRARVGAGGWIEKAW